MIKTHEQIQEEKKQEFLNLIGFFDNELILDKPIRFRETPHSPTIKVYKISVNDYDKYNLELDTIIQTLRLYKHKKNESN